MLSKTRQRFFQYIYLKKALVAQYFALIYIIKNRWLIPFFLIKTKLMKCYTVRYIKVSIPKCYLSDFPKTRTSPLRYRHIAGHFESFNCLKFQTSFLKNKSFLWKIRLLLKVSTTMENATFQYKTGQPKVKANSIAQKMKFSIKDFFSKYDQIRWKNFCAVECRMGNTKRTCNKG